MVPTSPSAMSEMGQKRLWTPPCRLSGLHPRADAAEIMRHGSFGPEAEMAKLFKYVICARKKRIG
jgi:hypothetical protein